MLRTMASRYRVNGYQSGGVTTVAIMSQGLDPEQAASGLRALRSAQAIIEGEHGHVQLAPFLRLDLLNTATLWIWQADLENRSAEVREESVAGIRDEFWALTAHALAVGIALPADLDGRVAELSAMLAVPGFDPEAAAIARATSGSQFMLARLLFVTGAGALRDTEQLRTTIAAQRATLNDGHPRGATPEAFEALIASGRLAQLRAFVVKRKESTRFRPSRVDNKSKWVVTTTAVERTGPGRCCALWGTPQHRH
jgi:hypothetical protein